MASERRIRRHTAYFQGWATAFGNHDKQLDENRNLVWLFGEERIGLILTPRIKPILDPLFATSRNAGVPRIELGRRKIRIADATVGFGAEDQRVLDAVYALLSGTGDLHLLQTYHLVYPTGTRILTLSRQSPLALVYREIEPLTVRLT